MQKIETLKSLCPSSRPPNPIPQEKWLNSWAHDLTYTHLENNLPIYMYIKSYKNVYNLWFCYPMVGIYPRKKSPSLPSYPRKGQAHSHTSLYPCYFLCLEPCSSRFAYHWMSQLKHHHLWEVAHGHLSRLAPSPHKTSWHTAGMHILVERINVHSWNHHLVYFDKGYFLTHLGPKQLLLQRNNS